LAERTTQRACDIIREHGTGRRIEVISFIREILREFGAHD